MAKTSGASKEAGDDFSHKYNGGNTGQEERIEDDDGEVEIDIKRHASPTPPEAKVGTKVDANTQETVGGPQMQVDQDEDEDEYIEELFHVAQHLNLN